jgi:hypothetical protein
MGMDLLLVMTELPDGSVTTKNACDKIADAINGMSDKDRDWFRDQVGFDSDDEELIDIVQWYFINFRAGDYFRNVQDWETFDSDGNPRIVTIFGCESWGDVPEAYDAGSALAMLPEGWWK